jgi:hypothetical protein
LIVFLTFIQILIIRIQIRSGTGSGFVIKIYRSGFESRRPFILSPVFLTDTCVSYWHWHFLLTPVFLTDTGVPYWHRRFLLTQTAFLIDTGVSYWHQCFLLTPAFLTDTGVSCWHGVCYWHQRFLLTLAFLTDACVSYWRQGYLLTPVFFTDTGVSYWHRHFHTVAGVIPKPEPLRQARSSVRLPLSLWQLHCGCWASCHSLTRICNQN